MKFCEGKKKRWIKRISFFIGIAVFLILLLCQPFCHLPQLFEKNRQQESIDRLLDNRSLTDAHYQKLFQQTGLGKCAIDDLRKSPAYDKQDILEFQQAVFCDSKIECRRNSPVTRQDRILRSDGRKTPLAPVEEGDILVSFSSHSFGWRHGHAGLVIDAERGKCLEAVVFGCDSKVVNLDHWKNYSNFMILRLRGAGEDKRRAIADFARDNLCGVPYSLVSGMFGQKAPKGKDAVTAQCAYLIWYAFYQFGYDLDSDGGKLVTVNDLTNSPKLKPIQVYGSYFDKPSF